MPAFDDHLLVSAEYVTVTGTGVSDFGTFTDWLASVGP
jgi:hypothetical protein